MGIFLIVAPKTAHEQGKKWAGWAVIAIIITNMPKFLVTFFDVNVFASLIAKLVIFTLIGYGLGFMYFKFRNRNVNSSDCSDNSLACSNELTHQNIHIERPGNEARMPISIEAKPILNNQPPVKAMPAITIESSHQSMQEIEDRLYEQIAQEIETNAVDKGTWTKAFAQSGGDDKLTRVAYIKTRFEKLLVAEKIRLEAFQREQEREALQRKREEIIRIEIAQFEQENAEALRALQTSVEWFDFKVGCSRGSIGEVKKAAYKDPLLLYIANSNDGMTALHLAVNEKQQEVARYLAERGARVEARNSGGETPIDIAKRTGQTELATLLQDDGKSRFPVVTQAVRDMKSRTAMPKPDGPSHYVVLCISRDANDEQILAGYQNQKGIQESQKFQNAETEVRLKLIENAKEVLLDPVKRAAYDQSLD